MDSQKLGPVCGGDATSPLMSYFERKDSDYVYCMGSMDTAAAPAAVKEMANGSQEIDKAPAKKNVPRLPWIYRGWGRPLIYLDSHLRFWVYITTVPDFILWFGDFGFLYGTLVFGSTIFITTAREVSPTVGLVLDCANYVSLTVFFLSTYAFVLNSINRGYKAQVESWELGGRLGQKPRYIFVKLEPFTNADYWCGALYFLGTFCFMIAFGAAGAVSIAPDKVHLSSYGLAWLLNYLIILGNVFFVVGGIAWQISLYGLRGLWRGCFIPTRREDWTSQFWWAAWLFFWSGFLFMGGGALYYWTSPVNDVLNPRLAIILQLQVGSGLASFGYVIGCMLLLAKQSVEKLGPSLEAWDMEKASTGYSLIGIEIDS